MWRQALAASQCLALIGRACSAACRYGAAQNEQWWREAKSLMTTDAGVASDNTRCWLDPPNEGHRTSDFDAGSPVAAKLAQAARMLAASASESGLNGAWIGAFG